MGEIVIKAKYHEVKDFSEGLAAVQEEEQGLWGFINKQGEYIIEPKYKKCGDFFNGLAYVETTDYKEYLINKDDEIIWKYE